VTVRQHRNSDRDRQSRADRGDLRGAQSQSATNGDNRAVARTR